MACRFTLTQRVLPQGVKFPYMGGWRGLINRHYICENQAFSILHQAQEGRQELIKKDGGEMPVSIVLDRPLDEAKALVEDPDRLTEITAILESKQAHPNQMVNPDVRDHSRLHRCLFIEDSAPQDLHVQSR